jgi:hypothetical protein
MTDYAATIWKCSVANAQKLTPQHNWKWLGEADRWRELGHREIASRFQQKNVQQMHAGPMAMGPNTIYGDSRSKQRS